MATVCVSVTPPGDPPQTETWIGQGLRRHCQPFSAHHRPGHAIRGPLTCLWLLWRVCLPLSLPTPCKAPPEDLLISSAETGQVPSTAAGLSDGKKGSSAFYLLSRRFPPDAAQWFINHVNSCIVWASPKKTSDI
ncbi:hypothetical protein H920_04089 [Fukomys damarensis]|uniref:Uncharacterized protein n=1 Tax=Fukomys damarensis TaxID=885580 RepID=A0A091DW31_FUKDA|nr:hypothetical protein H920_04089 [Fukomys damarensis]